MNFEAYLISKKIDSEAFRKTEPATWEAWNTEFGLMHPNSFTAQKLYLINPVRRKYPLKETAPSPAVSETIPAAPAQKPPQPRPVGVMRPKPKIG